MILQWKKWVIGSAWVVSFGDTKIGVPHKDIIQTFLLNIFLLPLDEKLNTFQTTFKHLF